MPSAPATSSKRSVLEELGEARARRATGVLELEVADQTRKLFFREGQLHLAASHPLSERLGELIRRGPAWVDSRDGTALLEKLADSFANWGVRRAVFREGLGTLPADLVGPLPTARFQRLAAARSEEAIEQVDRLSSTNERLFVELPTPTAVRDQGWSPEELWIVERLRTPMTVTELENGSPIPGERLWRALAGLRAVGTVRVAADGHANAGAEEESHDLAERLAQRVEASLRERPLALDANAYLQRVARLLADAGALNHYELLGLAVDASAEAVQIAFEERARTVHPANAKHYRIPERSEALRYLFERVVSAYQTLSDPGLRVEYNSANQIAAPAPSLDPADRAAEVSKLARQHFQRALSEEANGDYQSALTLFEEVVRADPRAEYWCALARLQSKNSAWIDRAIESYRSALELDPLSQAIRFALGELHEKKGELEQARAQFQAAAHGTTPHPGAAAALSRLGLRTKASASSSGARLLGGLFRRE